MEKTRIPISTVLVTGAEGFVGSELTAELLRRDCRVVKARRSSRAGRESCKQGLVPLHKVCQVSNPSFGHVEVGDIGPDTDWTTALSGIDAVVHLAARVHMMRDTAGDPLAEFRRVNVEGTCSLAKAAAKAGVRRLVFLSSVKVNGEATGKGERPFRETDLPHPEDDYGLSKWEAEQALKEIARQKGIEVAVIRPPLVYGPSVKANFLNLIRLIESGVPLPLGSIRNQRSFIGLKNLVDLICRCLSHSAAAGETFLASDGYDVSTPELIRLVASALGKNVRLFSVPEWLVRAGGAISGKSKELMRLCGSLQIDSSKARQMLDWTPPCTMVEELTRVAAWRAMCR